MRTTNKVAPVDGADNLPVADVVGSLPGTKDGRGVGDFADDATVDAWVNEYLPDGDPTGLGDAFRFGVRAEGRYAGKSFPDAEPELRAEWSAQKNQRHPWADVREAVYAGFDRARDRRG